jgi:hypothetical protein
MSLAENQKIFGIGLPKTGTSTLGACFEYLGYKKAPYDLSLINAIAKQDFTHVAQSAERFNAFEDWPWPLVYKQVAEAYPDAKFILTERTDAAIWLQSLQRHTFRNTDKNSEYLREQFYGSTNPWQDEEKYRSFYTKHNAQVREYFKNKPHRLLVVNWEEGDGWVEVCGFLKKKVPQMNFPHLNKSKSSAFIFYALRKVYTLLNSMNSRIKRK